MDVVWLEGDSIWIHLAKITTIVTGYNQLNCVEIMNLLNQHCRPGLQLLEVKIIQTALQGNALFRADHTPWLRRHFHLTDGHITQDISCLVPYLKSTTVECRLAADFLPKNTHTKGHQNTLFFFRWKQNSLFILTQLQFISFAATNYNMLGFPQFSQHQLSFSLLVQVKENSD